MTERHARLHVANDALCVATTQRPTRFVLIWRYTCPRVSGESIRKESDYPRCLPRREPSRVVERIRELSTDHPRVRLVVVPCEIIVGATMRGRGADDSALSATKPKPRRDVSDPTGLGIGDRALECLPVQHIRG